MAKPKRDVYQEVTDSILHCLEQDLIPWHKPWTAASASTEWPCNAASGRPYSGLNVLLLWARAMERGFAAHRWLTFRQAKAAGGHVRKGERGTLVTLWKNYTKDVDGEEETLWFLKGFTVFNVEQCEGLELATEDPTPDAGVVRPEVTRVRAEELVKGSGATILHGGSRACYIPSLDQVHMPPLNCFESEDAYWGTVLHELVHWTGHKERLSRDQSGRGSMETYAREELVAELGSAFLCAQLGVPLEGLQHPAYLKHWIGVLKEDKRAIVRAAGAARRASELLLGYAEVPDRRLAGASAA